MEAVDFDDYCAARGRALVRLAYALTGDFHQAEDLVQAALMRCYGRWSKINDHNSYVRRVIVRIYVRSSRRRIEEPMAQVPDRVDVANQGGSDDGAIAYALLASLPPRQRAVLVLRYLEDLPDEIIAQQLKISVGTVKSQAARALGKLRTSPILPTLTQWESP
ncbi:MAG: SigE family RNA polymerase sigma factor [Acidothermus sp.]|nr:SigE family RNA polymerase sigma factor [Acidothermus sp.]